MIKAIDGFIKPPGPPTAAASPGHDGQRKAPAKLNREGADNRG